MEVETEAVPDTDAASAASQSTARASAAEVASESHGGSGGGELPPLTLHVLGIPHTLPTPAFSHCAFTGKVARFPRMMRSVGARVVYYGVEGADLDADEHVTLLTHAEWTALRQQAWAALFPTRPLADLDAPGTFVGDLARYDTALYVLFNARARAALLARLPRAADGAAVAAANAKAGHIVCLPFGRAHAAAIDGLDVLAVETGIGYVEPFLRFRVYESLAWYHWHLGAAKTTLGDAYHFVIPNSYDLQQWRVPLWPQRQRHVVGFLGRLCGVKGLAVVRDVARACPDVQFEVVGQGDAAPWLGGLPNVRVLPPLHGTSRAVFLANLAVLLAPSTFVEPFCGVAVEAQLVGTPVLASAHGGPTETVAHGVSGYLCHRRADYVAGVRRALRPNGFDRRAIAKAARERWDMYAVARRYRNVFDMMRGLYVEGGDWGGPRAYMDSDAAV